MKKDNVEMSKDFIESWGLNENWYLWVNNDFIG